MRSTSLQILANKSGCVQTNLLFFLYTTSEEKEYYEALFLSYRPRTKCSISQFFKTNCIHPIFTTTEPSRHAWAFSETVQKIFKITYTASRFSLLTSAKFVVNIKRVTLQHYRIFIVFLFSFNCFVTMCNLAFDTRGIVSTPASDIYEQLKTNAGKAIKIVRDY